MAYIGATEKGRNFASGWFLESEVGRVLKTRQISGNNDSVITNADGSKYVPMGTVWPANDATAEGIVYEDTDVTNGDIAGSVVVAGRVYEDRLNGTLAAAAKTALEDNGFKFIPNAPSVERPY